jgi:anti-anti-sigma factor
MQCEVEQLDGKIKIQFEGSISIYETKSVQQELLSCSTKCTDWELDLGGVDFCDTSGLQLLLSVKKMAEKEGISLKIVNVPDVVVAAMETVGLTPEQMINLKKIKQSVNDEE